MDDTTRLPLFRKAFAVGVNKHFSLIPDEKEVSVEERPSGDIVCTWGEIGTKFTFVGRVILADNSNTASVHIDEVTSSCSGGFPHAKYSIADISAEYEAMRAGL